MVRRNIVVDVKNNEDPGSTQESRRRFLKSGLVAAPILMTLAARPAQAQEVITGSLGAYGYGIDQTDDFEPLGADDTDGFGVL